jgi:Mg2+/Co2+ transporter CorB
MSPVAGPALAAILVLLVLSAVLTAARTAIAEASRSRLGELQKKGDARAGRVLASLEEEGRTEGALALWKGLALTIAGAFCGVLLMALPNVPDRMIAAALLLIAFAFLGFAVPRALGSARPEGVAMTLSSVIAGAAATVSISSVLEGAARGLLRLGGDGQQDGQTVHEELRETIDLHIKEGTVVKNDRDMLSGILAMQDLEVSDIMVHRTKMTMIDGAEDPREIVAKVLKSGHTRIPVWKDSPDNIVGVLHAKNLFAALQKHNGDAAKIDLEDILLPPWFVPDTRAIPDQLNAFLKRKSHFAIVVDEYGEVQGLVTLEDIIEEIVGDIKDEHDAVASGVRPKPDGSYLVDGAVPIRDLNRAFDWTLPDEEANTLAGLVIHEARMIPEVGQTFVFHGFRFEILKKRRHQITALRMVPLKREGEAETASPAGEGI